MARPGADIHAFCEAVTATSTPHASISNGTAPMLEMPSTRIIASGCVALIAAHSSLSGFITPVDVSLWVISTDT